MRKNEWKKNDTQGENDTAHVDEKLTTNDSHVPTERRRKKGQTMTSAEREKQ